MSNLQNLLDTAQQDKRTRLLLDALQLHPKARILIKGTAGAQRALLTASAFLQQSRIHLFIAGDKEEAAYIQNDLAGLLSQQTVHFFPDSFKRPGHFEELNQTQTLERADVVNRLSISASPREIIVTYPEALLEKVVAPKALNASRIDVHKGERLDVDTIIDVLTEHGFNREDFVFEPGQFSIRGGIVDIFSFGNDMPYRIELFDDEVESIRTFNPLTQRSVQQISHVSLVPNIHARFSKDQKVPFFDILPPNTILWVRDTLQIEDHLRHLHDKAAQFATTISSLDESDLAIFFRDQTLLNPDIVSENILAFPLILLGNESAAFNYNTIIAYNAKPQPAFNKQFNLLINNLQQNSRQGITNYLFTDNPKQIDRFYAIFEDLNADVKFHPVTCAIHEGFFDPDLKVACYTDHQIFERFHRYRLKQGYSKEMALNVRMLNELQPGDFVTHIDHGIGKYSGLEKININGHIQESVRLIYKNNDILYVSINSLHKIAKYAGKDGTEPQLHKLGSEAWKNLKAKTKKKVKDIAKELIQLYAKRKASPGFAFSPDNYLQNELEASFIYEDTPDQLKATIAVKEDMLRDYPMDRLICGDVGFGKTEVAVRAAFKTVLDKKQVAILVPTTILALQHAKTFSGRLKEFGVEVEYINRFRSPKEKRDILQLLKDGKIDIIIGTHALLSKEVAFKDLGLLIVDEEQKFGVSAKEKLRSFKVNVDTLTLTATPIPRTLQFSLMSARDLSVIRTPPPNRQPIHTEVRVFNEALIKEAIYYEVNRGGQVFFVHNRVKSLPDMTAMLQRLCPDVDFRMAHGQMDVDKLEKTLVDFIDKQFEVLVCTNIIETGLDIPNANTMIITDAHQFGMSDLHQLRGRIGRSNRKAFCYLFSPPLATLTSDARKRLRTIEEFSDLGSGIQIAMRDLDIRGAGNLLGAEQSGFIADIGFETFQRILDEAMRELKETEFKDLFQEEISANLHFVSDVIIDTDVEMLIPSDYVSNITERLALYTELDAIENEETLTAYAEKLQDRFGKIPPQIRELFDGLRLRWVCRQLGFERIILKNQKFRAYFIENPQSPFFESSRFKQILAFVNNNGKTEGLSFKQSNKSFIMVKDGVKNLKAAKNILEKVLNACLNP